MDNICTRKIERLAYEQLQAYRVNCYIEDDKDGFTGMRWEKYNVQLKIVCAANLYRDYIVTGIRHHDNLMRAHIKLIGQLELLKYSGGPGSEIQGFIDQYGTFHTREAAFQIALKAGQIKVGETEHPTKLFSEDLY